jgi:hypothetical protein
MTSRDAIEAKLIGSFPGHFVGAMPVRQFLDFLPEADGRPVIPNVVSPEERVRISHKHISDLSDFGALGSCYFYRNLSPILILLTPPVVLTPLSSWVGMNSSRAWGYTKVTTLETE